MTLAEWAILAGILIPAAGIVSGVMAALFTRRTGKETVDVQAAQVRVSEKNAHTQEIAMIIDGFTASHHALTAEVERLRGEHSQALARLEAATEDLVTARHDNEDLRRRVVAYGRQVAEMLFHVIALERMVPDPPGPPARPDWDPWPDPEPLGSTDDLGGSR